MGGSSSPSPPPSGVGQQKVDDEIAHFQSIPWCAKYLSSAAASISASSPSSSLFITRVFSREPPPPHAPQEDAFFNTTLQTPDTIPAFVCFYPGPEDRRAYLPRLQAFVTLGPMIAGYAGVSHGGVVASVLDEALSLLAPGTRWRGSKSEEESRQVAGVVTAYLTTRYVRRVKVPGTYLVTVWLVRKEGRKVFVEGVMEDEDGVKVASAEALFIELREKL